MQPGETRPTAEKVSKNRDPPPPAPPAAVAQQLR